MDEETLRHIRDRIERCRRLARQTTDDLARQALLDLADEGEADLRRLEEAARTDQPEIQLRMPDPPAS